MSTVSIVPPLPHPPFNRKTLHDAMDGCSACGGGEPFLDVGPVDDLEDPLHVVRPDVLVLQVVRVFPDVDAQQGHKSGRRFQGVLNTTKESKSEIKLCNT